MEIIIIMKNKLVTIIFMFFLITPFYPINYTLNGDNAYTLDYKRIQLSDTMTVQSTPFTIVHVLEKPYKSFFIPLYSSDNIVSTGIFSYIPIISNSFSIKKGLKNKCELTFRLAYSTPDFLKWRVILPGFIYDVGFKKEFFTTNLISSIYRIDGFCYYNSSPGLGLGIKNTLGIAVGNREKFTYNIFVGLSTMIEENLTTFSNIFFPGGSLTFIFINSPYLENNLSVNIKDTVILNIGAYIQYDFIYNTMQNSDYYYYYNYFVKLKKIVSMPCIGAYLSLNFRFPKRK